MNRFASKIRRSVSVKRRMRASRYRSHRPDAASQQEIRRTLRSTSAQAKLTISEPNDKNEQEANRIAGQVVSLPIEESLKGTSEIMVQGQIVEKKEGKDTFVENVNTRENQQKANDLHARLIKSKGGGQPLSEIISKFIKPRLGHDFNSVRVHTDTNAALMSRSLNTQAFTSGEDIYFNTNQYNPKSTVGKGILAHELTHVIQHNRAEKAFGKEIGKRTAARPHHFVSKLSGWPAIPVGRLLRQAEPKVLRDFAKKFPDAADLVRKSPEAMKLVKTASAKGAVFGGYPTVQHGSKQNAYTVGNTFYIPKTQTDKFKAMSDFVFEINNAMRDKQFKGVGKSGKKRKITAKQYAYKMVMLEIEAKLSTGMIWSKMRQKGYRARKWSKYDREFYLKSYKAFKAGKKTKHQITKEALKRTYKTGNFAGWTVERYYMAQYQHL